MITVARFQVPEDAHMLRCYLSNLEIEADVCDENTIQLVWHWSAAIGGVRVVVADEDAEEATAACREYSSVLRQDPQLITVARAWPLVFLCSFAMGAPALIFGRRIVDPKELNSVSKGRLIFIVWLYLATLIAVFLAFDFVPW